ncbi:hypothetical protein E4U42_005974 [Claviceps africana]|uniref:Uncharacterized protein n=1 Tax=Claviceps africana TaxID=83212 RepID=A0A8K0JBK4_9HYPO|nr:hypothetical protein E4U42_005974 [Claviceps africana]
MLATHRDLENVVHSHQQAAIKQQPKTPGARYPKTPGNHGRNDENAPNTILGKAGLASGARLGGTGKLAMGKATGPHPAVTPMENRSRAPLGNKTTNAKAKNAQPAGVKDIVRDIERTQAKPTSSRRLKKQPANLQPVKLNVQPDILDDADDELPKPEYAPPRPTPLPYESDVLPPGGLTFNGLKRKNLFKGYYQHFHNPIDKNGVSRNEKKFNNEIAALMRRAEVRNREEIGAFNWSPEDLAEGMTWNSGQLKTDGSAIARSGSSASHRQAPTVSARRAASALAIHPDRQARNASQPAPITSQVPKRSLSSIITGTKPANPVVTRPRTFGNSTGEVASRTTLGYNKGRSASSMVHRRGESHAAKQQLPFRPPPPTQTGSNLTVTPDRLGEAVSGTTEQSRPHLMSILGDADDEDLAPVQAPLFPSDDEEEEFEMKLTI